MDLKSGYPFWAVKNGLMHPFPKLQADTRCDVLVVGGGITGALIANELAESGQDVMVLEQRDVGWGSTAASTALLQYEIDTHLIDLARQYGEAPAVLAYRACAEAIPMLQSIAQPFRDIDFGRMRSLYIASRRRHRRTLAAEFALRDQHGLDVEWLDQDHLRERFHLTAPGAILSALAARVDPYRLAYRLFARLQRRGMRIHDRTAVETVTPRDRDVLVRTEDGLVVRSRHLVIAAGYAAQKWLSRPVAVNRSSYAFITDPISPSALGPLTDTLLWESARPYLYLRTTGDGRVLVGGEDDAIDVPARRDRRVESKSRRLLRRVKQLFPDLPLTPAFAWAGTFAETRDGLPWFGPHPELGNRVHFAMAYGGNGITYSMIGAGLIRATIERRPHPLAALFSFARDAG